MWPGSNITLTTSGDTVTIAATGGGSGDTNEFSFKTISVSGQNDVVADTDADTLEFIGGSEVTLTTNETDDSITIDAHGVQSLRFEDLTDYEAHEDLVAIADGADTDFLGSDNLSTAKYIPANRSSTPFGELHIEYDSEQRITNANIPVVGNRIGGSETDGDISWSGVIYKRISYIDDLQRLYVRLDAVPDESVFGTSETYLLNTDVDLQESYLSEKLPALNQSVLAFNTTDEEWQTTAMLGFNFHTEDVDGDGEERNVVSVPTPAPPAFEDLTNYHAPTTYNATASVSGVSEFLVASNSKYDCYLSQRGVNRIYSR